MRQLTFGYTGFYVDDVPATLDFYRRAFGIETHYLHPSRGYGELETGDTLLAFVSRQFLETADLLGGAQVVFPHRGEPPIGAQIAFVSRDIDGDWRRAVDAGASIVKDLEPKPWGQTVGYLLDLNGVLVELCTPSPRA
jgi:lactoylglutathione lyase